MGRSFFFGGGWWLGREDGWGGGKRRVYRRWRGGRPAPSGCGRRREEGDETRGGALQLQLGQPKVITEPVTVLHDDVRVNGWWIHDAEPTLVPLTTTRHGESLWIFRVKPPDFSCVEQPPGWVSPRSPFVFAGFTTLRPGGLLEDCDACRCR
jgi:hypothetical protein